MGLRDSHVIKLMANDWKVSFTHNSHFHFSVFFSYVFVFVLFLYSELIPVYFCLIQIFKFSLTYFSHNYYNYSMSQDVPECCRFLVLSTLDLHSPFDIHWSNQDPSLKF